MSHNVSLVSCVSGTKTLCAGPRVISTWKVIGRLFLQLTELDVVSIGIIPRQRYPVKWSSEQTPWNSPPQPRESPSSPPNGPAFRELACCGHWPTLSGVQFHSPSATELNGDTVETAARAFCLFHSIANRHRRIPNRAEQPTVGIWRSG